MITSITLHKTNFILIKDSNLKIKIKNYTRNIGSTLQDATAWNSDSD